MWKAYLKVIAKRLPQAIHVLDKFHIVAHLHKAVDEVRREESARLVKDGYEPILKKANTVSSNVQITSHQTKN